MRKFFFKLLTGISLDEYRAIDARATTALHTAERALKCAQLSQDRSEDCATMVKDRTETHIDFAHHPKGRHMVILVGRYRDKDYVNITELASSDFVRFVEDMRAYDRENLSRRGRMDAPVALRAVIDREEF